MSLRTVWRTLAICAVKRPLEALGIGLPYMRPREISALETLIRRLGPLRCLEWGAGRSTLHFSALLPPGGSWLAVEHDEKWWAMLESLAMGRARVELVRPNRTPLTGDGTFEELRDYILFPETLGLRFDLILIDGRARNECLTRAGRLLSPSGVLALHDANRAWYRPELAGLSHSLRLSDGRELGGGLWLGSESDLSALEEELLPAWKAGAIVERIFGVTPGPLDRYK
ncbi:MAG: hypothetical protein ACUVV6_07945 [Thermoplasmatota archaeon]